MGTADHGRWAGPVQPKRTQPKRTGFNVVPLIRHAMNVPDGDRAQPVHPYRGRIQQLRSEPRQPCGRRPDELVGHLVEPTRIQPAGQGIRLHGIEDR